MKVYGSEGTTRGVPRYSPPPCVGAKPHVISGDPDPKHILTSFVERQNLTMRMSMRRFTRLTNAFSKKFENHAHSVAIHFMHYNFVRVHQTTRVTPAMAAGVTDKLRELSDMVCVLENWEDEQEGAQVQSGLLNMEEDSSHVARVYGRLRVFLVVIVRS